MVYNNIVNKIKKEDKIVKKNKSIILRTEAGLSSV